MLVKNVVKVIVVIVYALLSVVVVHILMTIITKDVVLVVLFYGVVVGIDKQVRPLLLLIRRLTMTLTLTILY